MGKKSTVLGEIRGEDGTFKANMSYHVNMLYYIIYYIIFFFYSILYYIILYYIILLYYSILNIDIYYNIYIPMISLHMCICLFKGGAVFKIKPKPQGVFAQMIGFG